MADLDGGSTVLFGTGFLGHWLGSFLMRVVGTLPLVSIRFGGFCVLFLHP